MALGGEQIVAGIVLRVDTRGVTAGSRRAKQGMNSVEKAAKDAAAAVNRTRTAYQTLATGATSLGVVTGAAAMLTGRLSGAMLGSAEAFEKNMKMLAFTSQLDEASEGFKRLEKTALDAGRQTSFSPAEAAEGLRLMVAAGLSANQSMETLRPTLDLVAASAGRISLTEGSELIAATMKKFSLNAEDARRVVDQMAKATTKSNIQFEDLLGITDAMGSMPAMFKTTTAEALAMAGTLRNVGVSGREAGQKMQGFMNFVNRLSRFDAADFFGAQARGKKFLEPFLKGTNLAVDDLFRTDENGHKKLISTTEILKKVMTAFGELQDENLKIGAATAIFGQQGRAVVAAIEKGSMEIGGESFKGFEAFQKLLGEIEDSAGTAQGAAKKFLFETFSGAKVFLKGTLQTISTQILKPAILPALSRLIVMFGKMVNAVGAMVEASPFFRNLIGFAVVAVPAILALVTAVLGLVAVGTMAVSGFLAMKAGLMLLLPAGMTVLAGLKALLVSFVAAAAPILLKVALVIGAIWLAGFLLKKAWEKNFGGMRTTITAFWGKVKTIFAAFRSFLTDRTVGKGLWDSMTPGMKKVFFFLTQLHDRWKGFWSGLKDGLAEAGPGFKQMSDAIGEALGAVFAAFGELFGLFGFEVEAGASKWETFGMVVGVILSTIIETFALLVTGFAKAVGFIAFGWQQLFELLHEGQLWFTNVLKPALMAPFEAVLSVIQAVISVIAGPAMAHLRQFGEVAKGIGAFFGIGGPSLAELRAPLTPQGVNPQPRTPVSPTAPTTPPPPGAGGNNTDNSTKTVTQNITIPNADADEVVRKLNQAQRDQFEDEGDRAYQSVPVMPGAR